ncbi:hypothetical protein PYW07_012637 [Mythimna separata]|uniref:ZAD domain-containing protein n=1 Tax=Mythimna separata TaxID=271217 RepID=A0AAD7Y8C5_MYTSE|nr:hypothetical protein PYW07_012637 [Mythimna separata]
MGKLSMCRICLVENVRMCVVTNKSLQEMYEKLTDVPFVTEDRKPMFACFFCCTRLKQCCQLQRKCVEAEELLAQMLSEDYEQPLTNREHLGFLGRFITTPVENISIVDDCQIGSVAIKQELPAVYEEQDDVELQLTHLSEELDPENLYNSLSEVKEQHLSESEEDELVMEIKIEGEEEHELFENLRVREKEKLEVEKPECNPGIEDIPAHESESDPEDDVPLMQMKTEAEEGLEVPKRKRRACVTRRAADVKKPIQKRKHEDTIPAKQTMNVVSDSKIIQTSETMENVRMCVVTNKSLQETYEKLTDVPFVTEDRKPMLACSFCCTRLKQCCQLQRKCVEAEELLAQMLSEDYEEISLTNHGQFGFLGRLITTPVENISIGADCQIGSDAIKQELPAVCEEQDEVELQLTHLSEEVIPENLYNSHPDVEAHHSESEEEQLVMVFKIEEEEEHELSENLRVRDTEKPELTNPDKRDPSVEDKPAHESESDPEDDVLLMEMKTKAEEGQGVSKRKRRACGTRGLAVAEKPTLKRKLEDIIPAKQTMNVPSDSKMTQRTGRGGETNTTRKTRRYNSSQANDECTIRLENYPDV